MLASYLCKRGLGFHGSIFQGNRRSFKVKGSRFEHITKVTDRSQTLNWLDSGDVLLYNWPSSWGFARQLVDDTAWDHVSIVVRQRGERSTLEPRAPPVPRVAPAGFRGWDPPADGQLQIFEANSSGVWAYPLEQFFEVFGLQFCFVGLRALLPRPNHGGLPMIPDGVRQRPPALGLDEVQRDALELFVRKVWGRPYEKNLISELLRAVVKSPDIHDPHYIVKKSNENLSSVFCSELVAEVYQRLNLIPECALNSNEVLPSAFAGPMHKGASGIIDALMLRHNCELALSRERLLRWPSEVGDRFGVDEHELASELQYDFKLAKHGELRGKKW